MVPVDGFQRAIFIYSMYLLFIFLVTSGARKSGSKAGIRIRSNRKMHLGQFEQLHSVVSSTGGFYRAIVRTASHTEAKIKPISLLYPASSLQAEQYVRVGFFFRTYLSELSFLWKAFPAAFLKELLACKS